MTVQLIPAYLQNASHPASVFRAATSAPFTSPGVLAAGELAVSAQSTPNMSVSVSAGRAMVAGTSVSPPSGFTWSAQGLYAVLNDAPVSVTIAASDPTNPRIDLVYVQVQDSFYSGANNQVIIGVVTGTPAITPAVPALPTNALALSPVAVGANVTSIIAGNIGAAPAVAQLIPAPVVTHPGLSALATAVPSQTIGTSETILVWNTAGAVLNSRGNLTFNSGTGIITCTLAGTYRLMAQATFAAGTSGARVLGIKKNSTHVIASLQIASNLATLNVAAEFVLAVGDTVCVYGVAGTATAIGVSGDAYFSTMTFDYVSA